MLAKFDRWTQNKKIKKQIAENPENLSDLLLERQVFSLKRHSCNTILLAGVIGSGKTVLFHQLRDGVSLEESVPSMELKEDRFLLHSETTEEGVYEAKPEHVHVVDVPGHVDFWPKLFDYMHHAAGVVFLVDSFKFLSSREVAAEYLNNILTNADVVRNKIPVLIVCNKTEYVSAHSTEFIRKQLEELINKLRDSQSGFDFSQCCNKVTFARASGRTGDISAVKEFIKNHVKS